MLPASFSALAAAFNATAYLRADDVAHEPGGSTNDESTRAWCKPRMLSCRLRSMAVLLAKTTRRDVFAVVGGFLGDSGGASVVSGIRFHGFEP